MKRKLIVTTAMARTLLGMLVLLSAGVAFSSCSYAQKKKETIGKRVGNFPYDDVHSDKKTFRAVANAKSPNQDMAEKMALTSARNKMASQIKVTVKNVTDDYSNQLSTDNKTEFNQKFESMTRTVVDQTLVNVNQLPTEYRTIKPAKGSNDPIMWQAFVGLEMNRQDFMNSLNDAISKDDRLRVNYDKKKYEETFDKEMDKLEQQETAGTQDASSGQGQ